MCKTNAVPLNSSLRLAGDLADLSESQVVDVARLCVWAIHKGECLDSFIAWEAMSPQQQSLAAKLFDEIWRYVEEK